MGLRDRMLSSVAGQLGHPHGFAGQLVGPFLNRGNRRTIRAAVEALQVRPGERVTDLGFGGGLGLALLLEQVGATGEVFGVDLSQTMIRSAQRRFRRALGDGRLTVREGRLEQLPLNAGSLDAALTMNTFYFVDDLAAAARECARVLRPGGRLVVGLGDPVAMSKIPFTTYGFRLRPVPDVVAQLQAAGVTVTEHRRLGTDEHAYWLLLATR